MHTLFRTNTLNFSTLFRKKDKMNATLFNLHLELRNLTLQSLLLKIWSKKKISPYKSTQFCRQYPFLYFQDRVAGNFKKFSLRAGYFQWSTPQIPHVQDRGHKNHPRIYRPYKGVPSPPPDQNVRQSGLYSELKTTQSRTQYLHMKHFQNKYYCEHMKDYLKRRILKFVRFSSLGVFLHNCLKLPRPRPTEYFLGNV